MARQGSHDSAPEQKEMPFAVVQGTPVELPTDLGRLRLIDGFAQAGHADQILVSHDICTKTRLCHWGGHGYGHILRNIPALMRRLGFEPALIERLLRDTPLRLLTLPEAPA